MTHLSKGALVNFKSLRAVWIATNCVVASLLLAGCPGSTTKGNPSSKIPPPTTNLVPAGYMRDAYGCLVYRQMGGTLLETGGGCAKPVGDGTYYVYDTAAFRRNGNRAAGLSPKWLQDFSNRDYITIRAIDAKSPWMRTNVTTQAQEVFYNGQWVATYLYKQMNDQKSEEIRNEINAMISEPSRV